MDNQMQEATRKERADQTLWKVLGRLFQWRAFIFWTTASVGAASVIIALLLPNWYRGTARVLVPDSDGTSLVAGLLSNLPTTAASAFLGGGVTGDYTRYLAILTSRSMMETVVDSFDLVTVYETQGKKHPLEEALGMLEDHADFEIDMEFDFLSISVLDKDRQRAADMANFFVRCLNETNERLSTEGATRYRQSLEERYFEARAAMDSVLNAARQFQQQHGVYDLPIQMTTFFEQIGLLRQSALEAEVRFEALRTQYGADNAQVRAMEEVALAANRKYDEALAGQELLLPVPQAEVPDVAREFIALELEGAIQRSILEVMAPLYEEARFREEREAQAVQIVDKAIPPARKAKPKRSILCIVATLSAFFLVVIFVLAYEWWRDNHADFARRLKLSAGQ